MPRPECQQLDAQLNGELSELEAARFGAHLAGCQSCREAVAQQAWLDGLLRGTATAEAVPAGVTLVIDRVILRTRRRRQFACGFAAAAVLLLAFDIDFGNHSEPNETSSHTTSHQPPTTPVATSVATFVGSDDMIVVPHDSPYPNVTIVEVYPTMSARRRWQREAAARSLPVPKQFHGDPS